MVATYTVMFPLCERMTFLISRLVFLSLLSTALAAPQYLYNYGMYGYPASYYPLGGYADPRILYNPLYQPGVVNYQPVVQDASAATRGIVKFGNFLEINGEMETGTTLDTATATVSVVKGTFSIQQNGILDLFSNGEAKFKAYIMSSKDLTGMNIKLWVGTGDTCELALDDTVIMIMFLFIFHIIIF